MPAESDFASWLEVTLQALPAAIITIRIVDEAESAELNRQYRQKTGATNVLSFPADLPDEVDLPLLGDLVICAPLVESEAGAQGKAVTAHWAHLVVHGTLHLLGYDHIEAAEAEEMESLEARLLQQLGFPDPYA
ncbi:MAG TPA: rRNA maturation RNase YbeY [Xanthomonadales bacterium]|nr:rRNA maturation RNase YbeY [Xanthomonadales bacterium]